MLPDEGATPEDEFLRELLDRADRHAVAAEEFGKRLLVVARHRLLASSAPSTLADPLNLALAIRGASVKALSFWFGRLPVAAARPLERRGGPARALGQAIAAEVFEAVRGGAGAVVAPQAEDGVTASALERLAPLLDAVPAPPVVLGVWADALGADAPGAFFERVAQMDDAEWARAGYALQDLAHLGRLVDDAPPRGPPAASLAEAAAADLAACLSRPAFAQQREAATAAGWAPAEVQAWQASVLETVAAAYSAHAAHLDADLAAEAAAVAFTESACLEAVQPRPEVLTEYTGADFRAERSAALVESFRHAVRARVAERLGAQLMAVADEALVPLQRWLRAVGPRDPSVRLVLTELVINFEAAVVADAHPGESAAARLGRVASDDGIEQLLAGLVAEFGAAPEESLAFFETRRAQTAALRQGVRAERRASVQRDRMLAAGAFEWSARVQADIERHADAAYPNESLGLVLGWGRRQLYLPFENVAEAPTVSARFRGIDVQRVAAWCRRLGAQVQAHVHSHPGQGPLFSDEGAQNDVAFYRGLAAWNPEVRGIIIGVAPGPDGWVHRPAVWQFDHSGRLRAEGTLVRPEADFEGVAGAGHSPIGG